MTSINSRLRGTRNYTAVLMTPINSTLKIAEAGDAGRHLETGFRLTHIRSPRGARTRSLRARPPLANCSPANRLPRNLYAARIRGHRHP